MQKFLNSLAKFTLIALSVSLFWNVAITQAAFGVSPPWVKNNLLIPGSTLEETIYLSRSDPAKDMHAQIRIDGDEEVLKWLSISNQDNLIIRAGQQVFPMSVVVKVPEDAKLGDYTGGIFVKLTPLAEETIGGGQVAINLGAHISVELSVIDEEVTDYKVKSASLEPIKEDGPFAVNLEVKNTGNTDVSNIEGQIEVYDRASGEVIKTLAFLPATDPVAFNETQEIEMVYEEFVPEEGEYFVEVEATKDGETVYKDRLVQKVGTVPEAAIIVTPEDVLDTPATPETEGKAMYLIVAMAGLGLALLVVIAVLLYPIIRNRKRK